MQARSRHSRIEIEIQEAYWGNHVGIDGLYKVVVFKLRSDVALLPCLLHTRARTHTDWLARGWGGQLVKSLKQGGIVGILIWQWSQRHVLENYFVNQMGWHEPKCIYYQLNKNGCVDSHQGKTNRTVIHNRRML